MSKRLFFGIIRILNVYYVLLLLVRITGPTKFPSLGAYREQLKLFKEDLCLTEFFFPIGPTIHKNKAGKMSPFYFYFKMLKALALLDWCIKLQ